MLLNIPSASAPYARQMLTLLCCSKRPLSVSELVDAVAVELGQTPRYNPKRRLEDVNAIQEVCPGFTELGVDTLTEEPTIQIAHFSVQEYLESGRLQGHDVIEAFSIERANSHAQMAHICLTFLLEPKLAFSVEQYPFIIYAAEHWPGHFLESLTDESVEIRALQLFQCSRCLFLNWARIWERIQRSTRDVATTGEMSCWTFRLPLYLASFLGLYSVLRKLLNQLHSSHVPTGSRTTDSAAALLNQRHTHVDPTHVDWFRDSVLDGAVQQGHLEAVQLLLEHGAQPGSKSLHLALNIRSGDVAKLLIKHGAANVAPDATALLEASRRGIREVVEYVLDMGTDPNQTIHGSKWTPLMVAASYGHKDIAKLLLERGASVDSPRIIRAAVLHSAMGTRIGTSHSLLAFLSEEARDIDA